MHGDFEQHNSSRAAKKLLVETITRYDFLGSPGCFPVAGVGHQEGFSAAAVVLLSKLSCHCYALQLTATT